VPPSITLRELGAPVYYHEVTVRPLLGSHCRSPHGGFSCGQVILSTNIAESSITVPDIKYVIDFCLTKNIQTDLETNMTCLRLEWASKANCIQRKGRAGRVSNGESL